MGGGGRMSRVRSKDGTSIAYDRQGHGPAVILVGGGLTSRAEGVGNNAPLAAELAQHFTVYNYDRRGRGDSGDTPPYAVAREIEDIDALITEAAGASCLYGVSSGGMFALEAAAAGLAVHRLAVYDVPYDVSDDAPQRFADYRAQLSTVLAEGRRGDAVALFMRLAGAPEEDIAGARTSPYWPGLEAIAHTLAYDAACYGQPPAGRLAAITQPALVLTGRHAPEAPDLGGELPPGIFEQAADMITAQIPHAERQTLTGQAHVPDPKKLAPVLEHFFTR
jgi:pimeloyl-ACP methyl ester carboxylesterase